MSGLEAAEQKRKEKEREASKTSGVREERIGKLQEELDKKVHGSRVISQRIIV